MAPARRPIEERFWEKVDKISSPRGCWLWTACVNSKGYGQLNRGGQHGVHIGAHVFSWSMANGSTRGLFVCHKCDNPICVNPKHLFLGTQKDNIAHCTKKGRRAAGAANGNSRFTESDVKRMRGLHSQGMPQKAIAREFSASTTAVNLIVHRKVWRHI